MKILFVCKYNRFRSKAAQAILEKMSEKAEVESVGLYMDVLRSHVAKTVHDTLAKKGYKIREEAFKPLTEQEIKWADIIVVTANNVSPAGILPEGKTRTWEIQDCNEPDVKCVENTVNVLEKKVRELVKELRL